MQDRHATARLLRRLASSFELLSATGTLVCFLIAVASFNNPNFNPYLAFALYLAIICLFAFVCFGFHVLASLIERTQKEESTRKTVSATATNTKEVSSRHDLVESFDAFISHASENKEEFVRPLAEALKSRGFKIWYDEYELKVGDSLRRSVDNGLQLARFGIVVLSPEFFAKNWPQYELDGLVAKERNGGNVILPLWHNVTHSDVLKYSPTLADKIALSSASKTVDEVADKLAAQLK